MAGQLGVRLLGDFRLDGLDLAALRSRQARTVLKVLAVARGDAVSRDRLVDVVWPAGLPADPDRDLAVLVSRIRAFLGPSRVARSPHGYALAADWYDWDEVEALTRDAAARQAGGDLLGARAAAEAAVALARGPLLAGEPDGAWCAGPRGEAAAVVAEARAIAAATALATGHPLEARRHARAALAHDPYDEAAVRTLMRAHVAAGRPASALHEFGVLRTRLRDDLGASPSPATDHLHTLVLRGELTRDDGAAPALGPTLVGRDAELARLDGALTRAATGLTRVDVTGETGIGKSALVQAWAARARRGGATILVGTAVAGTGLGLQPVIEAVEAVESIAQPDRTTLPALPGRAASAAALRHVRFVALDKALARLADAAPLAVVIDDVHHADDLTLGWLAHLARRPVANRFLVVTVHPGEAPPALGPAGPDREVVALGPLSEAEAAAVVGPERAATLWARSGGNPLLLTELATAAGDDPVPSTVLDAVRARLERAGETAATIRAAAVLGSAIDLDLLAAVLDRPPRTVLEDLDAGRRGSFLADRDGVFVFRHEVVREAVVADVTPARRAWLHRAAATLLATRTAGDPLEVARHARAGGDRPLAARALAAAAERAVNGLDLPAAHALLTDAIDQADNVELRLQRARVSIGRADLDSADADADAALGAGAGARALEIKAWVARHRHDMESAVRLGRAGAAAAGPDDDSTRASCLLAVGLAQRGVGDLRGADETLAAAVALHPPADLGLDAWVGILRVHQGRPSEGLDALVPRVGAAGDRLLSYWVEHVVQMTAHAYGLVGRVGDALALLDRLEAEIERRGTGVRYAGVADTYRSWLLRNLGVGGAEDRARAALEHAGSPEIRAQATLDLADSLIGGGRLDEAAAAHADAVAAMDVRWFHNRWRAEQRAGVMAARLALAAGDWDAAGTAAGGVAVPAGGRGDERYATIATVLMAQAAARAGRAVDWERTDRALARLGALAAPEGWWLAADLADDTGSPQAGSVARSIAAALAAEAGDLAGPFRAVLARRFG